MTQDQLVIILILSVTVAMFLWGRWRHDMVALASLLACVAAGLVPADGAFLGFGHPAVITVACVLALSKGLQVSGAVDGMMRIVLPKSGSPFLSTTVLVGLAALLSSFMNNVGALALLMPVAAQIAAREELPPGKILMPLAFGSILGGMTTLIGTPPNLIIATFRSSDGASGFGMFDFTPVGLAVALTGIAFVIAFSRWLVPTRRRTGIEGFETGSYLTEARVGENSKIVGMSLREIDKMLEEADAQVIGLVRDERRIPAPGLFREVRSGDILTIEAEPESLASVLTSLGLKLEEEVHTAGESAKSDGPLEDGHKTESVADAPKPSKAIQSKDIVLSELAVLPGSPFIGRSASDIRLRSRYSINLLAVSRQGERSMSRLRTLPIAAGDVLLMQGTVEALREFGALFECVPLAERALRIPNSRNALVASVIMIGSIAAASVGLAPVAICFGAGLLAFMVMNVMSARSVYESIDWPVIVLLAALIPVAGAMATTGAADLIARWLLDGIARGNAVIALVLILIVTMTLSDFMNNAATAAVMAPISLNTASQLGVSGDPFLMAVAIGASCAFLTPIGHQNNTLILGPGGFHFGDYWRLGLPLEVIVVAVAVPMLLLVWPL
ncbi:MAG: SLC13 family permease [Rhodospirillaceae bacterium]|nr:SLC13 family permease [Rhodospirillaceae bacterium]